MSASASDALSIAVIVPVLNEAAEIGALLADLALHDFSERVVVDGGSADGTAEIVEGTTATLVRSPRGRGRQLNAGATRTSADVLLFLHADTRLPAEACDRMRAALRDGNVVGGCFRLSFDAAHPLLKLYARASAFDSVFTTFGDQAYFVRADVFRDLGGFAEWPFLEDVEMRRRLRQRGRFFKVNAAVVTSARRFRRRVLRQQVKNGLILCAFLAGVSPERLARFYAPERKSN